MLQQIFEGLVTLKPGSGSEIVGQLADSWTISPDGLTYTFKLKSGIKFQDGTDFNAAAAKFNFDRWLSIPKTYVDLGYTYYIDTVMTGKIAETTAPDPTTFTIKLKAPNSAFLVTLTLTPFTFSSPKALKDGDASAPDFKNNKYAQGGPPAAVGTGPFVFKEWVPGDHVTLTKNPDYWNKAAGGPYLDALTFKPIADTTATLNALQAGDVDISQTLAPVDVPTAQADTKLQYYDRGSACNVGVLAMNQKFKPFDNPKIRQAVAYAINRKAIVDAFFGETGVVLKNWAPPGTIFANDLAVPDYDVEKAKALIAESGVPAADLAFDFWYPSDVSRPYMPDPKGEFEAMQRDLEAVGFKPNPKTSPWRPDYLAAESRGDYPAFLIGWNCDWLGIDNFLYTAFFGYRGDPRRPEPGIRVQERRDERRDGRRPRLARMRRPRRPSGARRRTRSSPTCRRCRSCPARPRPPARSTSRASRPRRPSSSCSRTSGSTSKRLTGASGARRSNGEPADPPAACRSGDPPHPYSW